MPLRKSTVAYNAEYQEKVEVTVKLLPAFNQELRETRNVLWPDSTKIPEKNFVYH